MGTLWPHLMLMISVLNVETKGCGRIIVFSSIPCKICDGFTQSQKDMLCTPKYQIRKDSKAGVLIDIKDLTVMGP